MRAALPEVVYGNATRVILADDNELLCNFQVQADCFFNVRRWLPLDLNTFYKAVQYADGERVVRANVPKRAEVRDIKVWRESKLFQIDFSTFRRGVEAQIATEATPPFGGGWEGQGGGRGGLQT